MICKGVLINEKKVSCPLCKTIFTVSGNQWDFINVVCPTCGTQGKVSFELGEPTETPIIYIHDLTKNFGKFTAVDKLNLTIYKGEIYGLLGPNGSGKTTTIKMLCGLLSPTSGQATILGKSIPCKSLMINVGYMPQETALYLDNTVHENLSFFARIYGMTKDRFKPQEEQMLQFIDLERWRDSLVSTLSGGMKHRVSLACALIHEPKIVFLDEPTVGIDPELRVTFWEFFHSMIKKGITVIITTHYMDEADHCSRVGLLRQGKLIAKGKPSDLKHITGTMSLEDAFLKLAGKGMI